MSILICKHCKESYNTSWSYHNDDYCASCCHIESLEQENAELKKTISKLLSDLAESDNKTGAREAGLEKENAELKAENQVLSIGIKGVTGAKVNLNNAYAMLEAENKRLNSNWDNLEAWIKKSKINCTGGDRFWEGYDDFHGDVNCKIEEIKGG